MSRQEGQSSGEGLAGLGDGARRRPALRSRLAAARRPGAPPRVVPVHQMQVRYAVAVDHFDEEPAPGPTVEVRGDVVPVSRSQATGNAWRAPEVRDSRLQVQYRLGGKTGHSGGAHVLHSGDEPRRQADLEQLTLATGVPRRPTRRPEACGELRGAEEDSGGSARRGPGGIHGRQDRLHPRGPQTRRRGRLHGAPPRSVTIDRHATLGCPEFHRIEGVHI